RTCSPAASVRCARATSGCSPTPSRHESRTNGDPEALRRATYRFGDHFLDQFLSPAQTNFVQPADLPFQRHLDAHVGVPGGVRYAAEHATGLVDAEPGRALDELEPGLLDLPEARHLLALHDPQAQVPQRPDGGHRIAELRADLGGLRGLAPDEGTGR